MTQKETKKSSLAQTLRVPRLASAQQQSLQFLSLFITVEIFTEQMIHLQISYVSGVKYLLFLVSLFIFSCQDNMTKTHAFRLKPGADLKKSIETFVKEKDIKAGWISCGVGSLTQYHIRFANQPNGAKANGHFEIVSLTGTISVNGSHIHLSVSDSTGKTIGGHLLDENIVYTTAEIVITESDEVIFTREKDGTTEWEELQVKKK